MEARVVTGECRLCGENKVLTFEHIPPRSTFNRNTRYTTFTMNDMIGIDNPLTEMPKGKTKQGGIGLHSLCADCNSFLGRTYVKAYQKWVMAGLQVISSKDFDSAALYQIREQEPLKIIKQILSMFLALNDSWYYKEYPELVAFVKDPTSTVLPEKYRLFAYYNHEGRPRYAAHTVQYTEFGILNCTEIAFPPFGYLLTFGFAGEIPMLRDITSFKNGQGIMDIAIRLHVLPTYLPFLALDYRTKDQLENEIAEQIEVKERMKRDGTL